MSDRLGEEAIEYHRLAPAGKLAVVATKPLATQRVEIDGIGLLLRVGHAGVAA